MAHEVRKRGGKAIYLAPLRALAKEKIDDWTSPGSVFDGL
jgi:replicative superfamily II helicase